MKAHKCSFIKMILVNIKVPAALFMILNMYTKPKDSIISYRGEIILYRLVLYHRITKLKTAHKPMLGSVDQHLGLLVIQLYN